MAAATSIASDASTAASSSVLETVVDLTTVVEVMMVEVYWCTTLSYRISARTFCWKLSSTSVSAAATAASRA